MNAEFNHKIGKNFNLVTLTINTEENVTVELFLDKDIDVSLQSTLDKLEVIHKALQTISSAINDDYVDIEISK